MTTTSVRLPVPLRETAESYGRSVDRSLAWLLREALVEYLERHMDAPAEAPPGQGSADPAPDPAPASDEAVDCPGRRGHTPEQGAGPFPSCKHCGAFRVNGVWKRP